MDQERKKAESTVQQIGRLDIQAAPLMAVLSAPPDDPERVTKALEQSSALAARVLSVTNSAAIGVVGEINDIRRAVIHMGAARARSIALAFGLHMLALDSGLDEDTARRLWANSLEKACLARLVAATCDPGQADRAYALGLIQDVGLSALMAIDSGFYQNLDANQNRSINEPLYQLEHKHFGIDHAQLGNYLLQKWNASPILCDEVLNHHQPVLIRDDPTPVNLGNLVAGMLPHDCEAMTPDRMEWLTAIHGQFLSSAYQTPEDLIQKAVRLAREVHGKAPSIRIDHAARLRMLNLVETDTANIIRQICEMESQLTRKHEQVHALQFEAMTDPLTQVLNRRGFDRLGERRLQTAIDRGLPVCAVVIDLDGFKSVNDTYGHDAGDKVLVEVSQIIRDNIDSNDLFGRLGGDEFAILQINVDREIARRIVNRVAETCFNHTVELEDGHRTPVRFSVGVATCNQPTTKTKIIDLINTADEAMYASKRTGPGEMTFVEYPGRQKAS